MAYLDAFTANLFQSDSEGRLVFAPRGTRGRAYLVSPERASSYSRFVRIYYGAMMVGIFAVVMLVGPIAAAVVGLLWLAGLVWKVRQFVRGLTEAPERPVVTSGNARDQRLRAMGSHTILTITAISATLAVVGYWFLIQGSRHWSAWLLTAYFTLVAVLYGRALGRLRNRGAAT